MRRGTVRLSIQPFFALPLPPLLAEADTATLPVAEVAMPAAAAAAGAGKLRRYTAETKSAYDTSPSLVDAAVARSTFKSASAGALQC